MKTGTMLWLIKFTQQLFCGPLGHGY